MPVLPFGRRQEGGAARNELEAVLDALPILVAAFDRDARLLFMNDAGAELIDFHSRPMDECLLSDLYPEDEAERILARAVPDALSRGAWTGHARLVGAHGEELETWQHLASHGRAAHPSVAFTLSAGSVTSTKPRGADPDGPLAIVHSIHNVLSPIRAYADLAAHLIGPGHRAEPYLEQIVTACERGRALSERLSKSSRKRLAAGAEIDLVVTAREVESWLSVCRPDLSVEVSSSNPSLNITADPVQIHQVLLNVAQNAVDSLRGRTGTISIRVDESGPPAESPLAEARYALVTVTDDGPGLTEPALSYLFEPHFTTKPRGQGLGLSVSQRILHEHGGAIHVENTHPSGVTVQIYLPLDPTHS